MGKNMKLRAKAVGLSHDSVTSQLLALKNSVSFSAHLSPLLARKNDVRLYLEDCSEGKGVRWELRPCLLPKLGAQKCRLLPTQHLYQPTLSPQHHSEGLCLLYLLHPWL